MAVVRLAIKRIQINAVDYVHGIYDIALGLGHLLAIRIANQAVYVDVFERDLFLETQRHHHHACDPEKDDVKASYQCARGMKAF